jgi:hypothetical protein
MSKTKDRPKDAPVSFVQITDCCCGVAHRMKQQSWEKFRHFTKGKAPTVPVGSGVAAWRVPRIYIACHGLAAAELAALALQYGWEKV